MFLGKQMSLSCESSFRILGAELKLPILGSDVNSRSNLLADMDSTLLDAIFLYFQYKNRSSLLSDPDGITNVNTIVTDSRVALFNHNVVCKRVDNAFFYFASVCLEFEDEN